MRRIEYSNRNRLKQDYLALFKGKHLLQKEWVPLREEIISAGGNAKLYPADIDDLLISEFNKLAMLFYDYIEVDCPKELQNRLYQFFAYKTKWQKVISKFFIEHQGVIQFDVCSYCETTYINTYTTQSSIKNHFNLDHFLPKSICPLVSLSLFNLVPCCPVCNQKLKRGIILGSNVQETIMLSPTSDYYAFDSNTKFTVVPTNLDSSIRFLENGNNYQLKIFSQLSVFQKSIETFHLNERYDFHKSKALRLLDLIRDYPSSHIKMIHKTLFSKGIFFSEDKIAEDIFGLKHKIEEHHAFAKLIHDVMELYRK